ncbi:MAG: UbiD family decarboxylase, partial [Thermodesulfobacteriota bacterium]|nr:UbiD family decarboxylase [Thermodesulfobacteriota bacterium]
MAYKNLRDWIRTLEKEGELARIKAEVNWDLEIGGIAQENFDRRGPALLFENIKDYRDTICTQFFTASLSKYSRIAMMMGLPGDTDTRKLIEIYRDRVKNPVKPVKVETGAVKENIIGPDGVDLLQFPAPKWHHLDGGRYIGTFDGVVTKDPETGWVNVGLYRRMIHDRNHTGITIIHGQHIWQHWRKHKKLGLKTMPVAMVNGWDPVLPMSTSASFPPGVCEYDMMGALRQEPVPLVKCETIDLEVPADAEIVVEGEISLDFDNFRFEGPFGEYHGYYASIGSSKPVITWKCMTHRDDPILQGTLEGVPVNESDLVTSVSWSAIYLEFLQQQMTGITGVYVDPSSNVFVQVDNSYIGQPQQVAFALWGLGGSATLGKNIMVVDQDIDIFDLDRLAWAFATRVLP